jgi:hypothetical protein
VRTVTYGIYFTGVAGPTSKKNLDAETALKWHKTYSKYAADLVIKDGEGRPVSKEQLLRNLTCH